jgi:hypothetical protein
MRIDARLISANTRRSVTTIQVLVTTLAAVVASGCASGAAASKPAPPPATVSTTGGAAVTATDGAADAAYYRERAAALAKESPDELARTDFGRFRRGRLYAADAMDSKAAQSLEAELTAALDRGDFPAVVDLTSQVLASDEADIRAHMLRAVALGKLQRPAEADFHRGVAVGMIKSIMRTGDGRAVSSAWTVFRVKEEYEIIKVLGCAVVSQSLTSDGARQLDVLEARRPRDGATIRVYFDITELMAEETKLFRARRQRE